jgi:hypothetical protein
VPPFIRIGFAPGNGAVFSPAAPSFSLSVRVVPRLGC